MPQISLAKKSRRAPRSETRPAPLVNAGQWEISRQIGLPLEAVAREIGVSTMAVSNWRRGTQVPEYSRRKRIEISYGVPVALWLRRAPSSELERLTAWGLAPDDPELTAWLATLAPGAAFTLAELRELRA